SREDHSPLSAKHRFTLRGSRRTRALWGGWSRRTRTSAEARNAARPPRGAWKGVARCRAASHTVLNRLEREARQPPQQSQPAEDGLPVRPLRISGIHGVPLYAGSRVTDSVVTGTAS